MAGASTTVEELRVLVQKRSDQVARMSAEVGLAEVELESLREDLANADKELAGTVPRTLLDMLFLPGIVFLMVSSIACPCGMTMGKIAAGVGTKSKRSPGYEGVVVSGEVPVGTLCDVRVGTIAIDTCMATVTCDEFQYRERQPCRTVTQTYRCGQDNEKTCKRFHRVAGGADHKARPYFRYDEWRNHLLIIDGGQKLEILLLTTMDK